MAVEQILSELGINPQRVELGTVTLSAPLLPEQREALRKILEEYGFELLDDVQRIL